MWRSSQHAHRSDRSSGENASRLPAGRSICRPAPGLTSPVVAMPLLSNGLPGTGGSRDIVASAPGAPVYAVIPGYSGQASPVNAPAATNTGLKVGDSVYLSGVPGLAAGWYTLLPGYYALMPGAFRVTTVQLSADLPAVSRRASPMLLSGRGPLWRVGDRRDGFAHLAAAGDVRRRGADVLGIRRLSRDHILHAVRARQ